MHIRQVEFDPEVIMKIIACIGILFISLIFTTGITAKSYANEDLGLEVSYHNNYIEITNKSNCELKELYFALAHVDTKNELITDLYLRNILCN